MSPWYLSLAYTTTHALSLALLQTLWQGMLLYGCLCLSLFLLKGATSTVRYMLSLVSIGILSTWFVYDWVHQLNIFDATASPTSALNEQATHSHLTVPVSVAPGISNIMYMIDSYLPIFWYIYIPGLLFMMLRLSLNIFGIYQLRIKNITQEQTLQDTIATLAQQMNIGRHVGLFISERVNVPIMLGTMRPYILLPVSILTQLNAEQLQAILVHELAHIKRHDYILNLLQVIVETILFFNPFVWLINNTVRREREHCCDDIVVAKTQQPYQYATALAQLEHGRNMPSYLMAATGNKNYLFTRIKRIIEMKKTPVTRHSTPGILLICIALLIPMLWFTPGFAQKAKDKNSDSTRNVKKTIIISDSTRVGMQYAPIRDDEKDDNDAVSEGNKASIVEDKRATKYSGDTTISAILKEVADAMAETEKIDWKEVNRAIADAEKQMKERDEQMKQRDEQMRKRNDEIGDLDINIDKKNTDAIKKQLDEIDWQKISADISGAMKEVKKQFADSSVQRTMKTIMEKIVLDKENAGDSYDMLAMMEADGLIDRKEGFEIEKKGQHLYINCEEQPHSVYNKYHGYLHGNNVTMKGKKDRLKINIHN